MPQKSYKRKSAGTADAADRIASAVLMAAATGHADMISPARIAKDTRLPVSAVSRLFETSAEAASFVFIHAAAGIPLLEDGLPPKDRVFESVMAYIDILQTARDGYVAVAPFFQSAPHRLGDMLWRVSGKIIVSSGIESSHALVARIGLVPILAATLHTWKNDGGPDLAKTMAALDKHLSRADSAMQTLIDRRIMPEG